MRIFHFNFSGIEVTVSQHENSDKLFDELLEKDKDHPDVADERIPYYAELWPSAIALAGFIAAHPELVKGKKVLEIGCGVALPGIVASKAGGSVVLTDYVSEALELARHNWNLNFSHAPDVTLLDWREPGHQNAEVVLASDIAYESRSFEPVIRALKELISANGIALVSEPNRKFASAFFDSLNMEFSVEEFQETVLKEDINYRIRIFLLRKR